MIAEAFATTGLALQIATELVPGQFVLLAGLGNLTKAVGKGMSKPCFRIIQTHFARQNNVGSVAATEEVGLFLYLNAHVHTDVYMGTYAYALPYARHKEESSLEQEIG